MSSGIKMITTAQSSLSCCKALTNDFMGGCNEVIDGEGDDTGTLPKALSKLECQHRIFLQIHYCIV